MTDIKQPKGILKYLWKKKSTTTWIQANEKDLVKNNIREK